MKASTKKILITAIVAVLIITVVSAVCSFIAMTKEFDHDLFYFKRGSTTAALAMYLPVAAAVLSLVCGLLVGRQIKFTDAPAANVPTVFASVLSGLLVIVSSVFAFMGAEPLAGISLGAAVTGFVCGAYLIILPFMGNKPFMSLLSFAPVVWTALKLLEEYFREGEAINSQIRTINLTMLAFLLLFFAEDVRFGINRQIPGAYYFCILSATAFTGSAVLPKLAVILTDNTRFGFSVIEWCMGAALFMFLLARLSALPAVTADRDAPETDDSL